MKTVLYNYQKKAVRKMHHFNGRVLLADQMGLGKSLESLSYWSEIGRPTGLIVCPASIKWVWQHEAWQHLGVRATILQGRTRKSAVNVREKPELVIINYDILDAWIEYILSIQPQLLMVDECHYIRNWSTKRTKAVRWIAKSIPKIICISGTPLTNRPDELWTTINLIRPDLFSSRHQYRWRYCRPQLKPWGWEYKGAENLCELHRRLSAAMMIRRLKADVLTELPDKFRSVVPLDIQKPKEYFEALNDFITWLSKKSILKAKKAAKAEQLTKLGYLKRLAAELKMKAVLDWIDNFLEESDGKIVLMAVHTKIIEKLQKHYHSNCVVVTGATSQHVRKDSVRAFQNNPKIRVFIGNIVAAGEGITLTAASDLAFIELDWIPARHTQAEDRIHRIGQKNAAMIHYLIAKGTIEEELCQIIQEKQAILSATLDGGKAQTELNIYSELQDKLLKG